MPIISKIFLASQTISFFTGIYYYKIYQDQTKLFENIENSNELDFDYIADINEIPLNKLIVLKARTDEEDNL